MNPSEDLGMPLPLCLYDTDPISDLNIQPPAQEGSLKKNLGELLSSGMFSDLTVRCGGKDFKVHKIILYLQSSYFRKLLGGKFKEAAENHNVIELDDEPDVVNVMVFYFYNFVYCDAVYRGEDHMLFTAKVYAVADKYDVPELRSMAAERLRNICKPKTSLEDFLATVRLIDSRCHPADRTLWNVVTLAMKVNMAYLLDAPEFKKLIEDLPQLKFELLASFARSPTPLNLEPARRLR